MQQEHNTAARQHLNRAEDLVSELRARGDASAGELIDGLERAWSEIDACRDLLAAA